MTKNEMARIELLEIAHEAGFQTGSILFADGASSSPLIRPIGENCIVPLRNLVSIILERAACISEQTAKMHAAQSGLEIQDEIARRLREMKTELQSP